MFLKSQVRPILGEKQIDITHSAALRGHCRRVLRSVVGSAILADRPRLPLEGNAPLAGTGEGWAPQMKSPSPNGKGESRPRCRKDQLLVQRRTAILPVQLP